MKRKGSALLIVLGVLSFLVVSAVSFAAYMRRARLPSSYLRRSVAARDLAKAALARAIDEIDRAIMRNPHPGIGTERLSGEGENRNTWRNRVFFRGDIPPYDPDDSWVRRQLAKTAPTLTFEGLAYIPPPLVNEVRYWSRLTSTAEWKSFGYDAGRYAYCAIDVSDYFDVNRLVADYPRSSAANRRVTIAHLFEDPSHASAPSGADAWDTFMQQFRDIDEESLDIRFDSKTKMPLVSLADFNLALGNKGAIGRMKSPFVEYLKAGTGAFYPGGGGAQDETYAAMTFLTDGWFPREVRRNGNAEVETYDLSNGRYQPYRMADLQKGGPLMLSRTTSLYKQQASPSDEAKAWYDRLGGLGMTALADYLDADHVPMSLAVPTTERVPMICGVEPDFAQPLSLGVTKTQGALTGWNGAQLPPSSAQITQRKVEQIVRWSIKRDGIARAFLGGRIHTLVAYPFLHKEDSDNSNWTLDGKIAMFFTSDAAVPFRTDNDSDALHMRTSTLPDTGIDVGTGVMTVKLDGAIPKFPDKVADEEDAVWEGDLDLRNGVRLADDLEKPGNELLRVTYKWTQTRNVSGSWTPTFQAVLADPARFGATLEAHTSIPALNGNAGSIGSADADFADDALSSKLAADPNWKKRVYLNLAVWLRIKDSDGKVVDMVPASIADDAIQNSVNDQMIDLLLRGGSQAVDGSKWPLLKFGIGIQFDFGIDGMKRLENNSMDMVLSPAAVMVPDPRHNHAPENWYAVAGGNITKSKWLETNLVGDDATRNRDIFMATSDAGYLQSIYELAFLPRFTNLETVGNYGNSGNYNIPQRNWNGNEYAAAAGNTLNEMFMWRTYDPINDNEDAFENLPFTSEGTGMKVNPYSDSTNVLMAAFANTPIDWRRSSTNVMDGATDYASMSVADFNNKYAWNEYSSGGEFAWGDLEKVAGRFIDEIRNNGSYKSWKRAWNDIWGRAAVNDSENELLGMPLSSETAHLWDADRKFLYGFWRDCFAAKQQLFLVFVRAEPLMPCGGSANQLPPQLGARAVALVWRDPATYDGSNDGYPHRTRILFYRPLD